MGWLDVINVGLNLGNAAISANNAAKLEQLQRQGAGAEAMRAIIAYLRDQIFHYKQTAEAILAREAQAPKIAAGSMKFLEVNLVESAITPELFLDLGDKEYCANTTRMIRENSARMYNQLAPDERLEVDRVVQSARRMPDYDQYLANYEKYQQLKAARPIYEKYKSRNTCLAKSAYLIWGYFGLIVPAVFAFPGFVSNSSLGQTAGLLGLVLGVAVYIGGFVAIRRYQHSAEFGPAKKVVEEVQGSLDVARMQTLDAEFGGPQHAQRLQGQAQATLDSFLQGAQLLPA